MDKYLAYFDLLGTKNLAGNERDYFKKISALQKIIINNAVFLKTNDNKSNIAFFSDSCYIESYNLTEIITFLDRVRNELLSRSLYFNCALIKIETDYTDSFEYFTEITHIEDANKEDANKISGIAFYDHNVAKAYIAQDNFKGIGIYLDSSIIQDMQNDEFLQKKYFKNIFISKYDDYNTITFFYDVPCLAPTVEGSWTKSVIKSYYTASCDNEKYGRYYISLLSNMLYNSDCRNIEWNNATGQFENAPQLISALWQIFMDKKRYSILTCIDILVFVFLDKLFSESILSNDQMFNIVSRLLETDAIGNKYKTAMDNVPINAFALDVKNKERFKELCRKYIIISTISSEDT